MSRWVKISSAVGGAFIVIVLVVAIAIASLGSDGGDDAAGSDGDGRSQQPFPGGGPPRGFDREGFQAFQNCLEENGVELPEPGENAGSPPTGFDPSDPERQEAFSECQDELPEGAGPPGGAPSF
jgi:hypothetical protein